MKRNIILPNRCDEIRDLFELPFFDVSVERIIIILPISLSLVYDAFNGCLGQGQIFYYTEIDL